MTPLIDELLNASPAIRYVAINHHNEIAMRSRAGLENASSSESDKYEELIVNPTLLKLVTQRGNIDCGGARFAVIRYGNFWQWIRPTKTGHVSVAIEADTDPFPIIAIVDRIVGSQA